MKDIPKGNTNNKETAVVVVDSFEKKPDPRHEPEIEVCKKLDPIKMAARSTSAEPSAKVAVAPPADSETADALAEFGIVGRPLAELADSGLDRREIRWKCKALQAGGTQPGGMVLALRLMARMKAAGKATGCPAKHRPPVAPKPVEVIEDDAERAEREAWASRCFAAMKAGEPLSNIQDIQISPLEKMLG